MRREAERPALAAVPLGSRRALDSATRDGFDAREIDSLRVTHVRDRTQSLLQSLDRGAALTARDVVQAGADLQQHAHERNLVAHGLEEELLEQIARFEPVPVVEETERGGETRIVFEGRSHAGIVDFAPWSER